MRGRKRGVAGLVTALAFVVPARSLRAEGSAVVRDESKRAEALRHFQLGLELVDKKAWDGALVEFLESRRLYPTYNATKNAAVCLRELNRYDEALDMYEEALARFGGEISADERKAVDSDVASLGRFVGTLSIVGDQAGARVTVDGRERGTTPLPKGVRVNVGTHAVRVTKEGFEAYETRVMVASGANVEIDAKLPSIASTGTLRVVEASGAAADVVVDGAVVGKTPWEGKLAAGTHAIGLRMGGGRGAPTRAVTVSVGTTSELRLEAVALPGKLRIDATPADATIAIDDRDVGKGSWEGDVAGGPHAIRIRADGYFPAQRAIEASADVPLVVRVTLDARARVYAELVAGALPSAGWVRMTAEDLPAGARTENGSKSFLGVVRAGYMVHEHVGVDLGFGAIFGGHTRAIAETIQTPVGPLVDPSFQEEMDVSAPLFLVGVLYRVLDQTPITFRVSAGTTPWRTKVFYATSSAGIPQPNGSTFTQRWDPRGQTQWVPIVAPEMRVGLRLGTTVVLDLGVVALIAFPSATTLGLPGQFDAGYGGTSTPAHANELRSGATLALLPTLGVHVDL